MHIVLTGQSLLQSDPRVETPGATAAIAPLARGDVVFTNFETTIKEKQDSLDNLRPFPGSGGHFAPPASLDALKSWGFNLLAMSNNHAFDFGVTGVLNALRHAEAEGLVHAGTGRTLSEAAAPAYLKTAKGTVALVSMASGLMHPDAAAGEHRPGVNEIHLVGGAPNVDAGRPTAEDEKRILDSIREARRHADLVISYHHNHVYDKDFAPMMISRDPARLRPPAWIVRWAHEQVDAGADIVILHGAPILQGIEIYNGKPIFYDLGNFIFQLPLRSSNVFEPAVWDSAVAKVEFEGRTLKEISIQPIVLNATGRGEGVLAVATRGIPAAATGEKAHDILARLAAASRPFGTTVLIHDGRGEIRPAAAHDRPAP